MKKIFLSAMVLAAAVGCNKTEVVGGNTAQGVEIRLGSSMETSVASKAAVSGDVAVKGLQFLRLDQDAALGVPTDFSGKLPFTGERIVGGDIKFGSSQLFDETAAGANAYIASFFPSGALAANVITWNIDGKTDVMTAAAVDAGNKTTPLAPVLNYLHQLAQVEVVCKASVAGATVQGRWGDILSIRVANTPTTFSYDLTTMKTSASATLGFLTMVKPGYSEDFVAIPVPASTSVAVNAVAMIAPMNSRTFSLEVVTQKAPSAAVTNTITVDLGEGKKVERAKRHVITLTFYPAQTGTPIAVTSSAIEDWTDGATGGGDVK